MSTPDELLDAVARFWSIPPPAPQNLWRSDAFLRLLATCREIYGVTGRLGLESALNNALRSIGTPMLLRADQQHLAAKPDEAARRLHQAFTMKTATRTYLCPLDLAEQLINVSFGPAEICDLKPLDLDKLVDQVSLLRWDPRWRFDSARFCRFTWLVVRETYQVANHAGTRALPVLGMTFDRPLGVIEPHRRKFPDAVEDALTLLLMPPWEDCVDSPTFDWRPFYIPWIYVVDDDLFVARSPSSSADSLNWTYAHYPDDDGEEVEIEVPATLGLEQPLVADTMSVLNNATWTRFTQAKASDLFATRVRHFLTHAFHVSGVDEFQAHLLVVEAALGLPEDFPHHRPKKAKLPKGTPKPPDPPMGRTALVLRVSRLLDDATAGETFHRLYDVRSEYLHGREMVDGISADSRNQARALARRTISRLMHLASEDPSLKREVFLKSLTANL